jgi:tRNA(Ile2) C34 agmatinyltransferase TiaS
MNRLIKTTMPFAAVLILAACGGNENKEATHEAHETTEQASEQTAATATGGAVALKDQDLNAVYQHYIHLSTALTNGDMSEAKVASNAIEAGAKAMQGGGAIAASAASITAASDIEVQRAAFQKLSNEMIAKVKKSGLTNGEVYVEYCPMAFNDKGASWLSSSKEIRNPYFGDKMLNCGEVTETIK